MLLLLVTNVTRRLNFPILSLIIILHNLKYNEYLYQSNKLNLSICHKSRKTICYINFMVTGEV